ncbi:MAG: FIVAR domain-containing protein [Candidatus Faecousia sp.]|nr:FIVAR domain-containing protein [Candidatus Faecousia sp.]
MNNDTYGNGSRTLYNCIQTNCYYVLRVADKLGSSDGNYKKDARDPSNTNWTFYHSTEENIYNEWYPADISEHGLKSENAADVPDANLGGGYFLIWNDYATVSTEKQMWEGAPAAGNSSGTYYLLDRMWSNIIKMWNSDVNRTVIFNNFKTVRDSLGYFPGYKAPSTAASLPNATNPTKATRADHSALTAALANKISRDGYTADSYAAYESAYNNAQTVNSNDGATEAELTEALDNLKNAEANLMRVVPPMSVVLKTTVNGEERTIATKSLAVEDGASTFSIYLAPLTGYQYERAEGATFVPLASGDGSGFLRGEVGSGTSVTVWYKNTPSLDRLNSLVAESESAQGSYTDASWQVYQNALSAAQTFTVSNTTTQADVDAVVATLEQARSKLVAGSDATKVIEVVKLAASTPVGKQIALKITTTPNVEELSVEGVTMTLCTGKVQTLNTGDTVKIWLVYIPATTAGKYTYTIYAGSASEQVAVTVN